MIKRDFLSLYHESLQCKDLGLLASALRKRQEATARAGGDKGLYALGKANEAMLLGHHIGDGLKAYAAAKEALADRESFAKADAEWEKERGFSLLRDCLGFIVYWSESYKEALLYCEELQKRENPPPDIAMTIQQIHDRQREGKSWWEVQKAFAHVFFSRNSPERDLGKYASAMAILHCILAREEGQKSGYEMDEESVFDLLDDYLALSLRSYCVIFKNFRTAIDHGVPLGHVDGPSEQFIIFEEPLKQWLRLMPECPEKWKPTFQSRYKEFMGSPFPMYPSLMRQLGAFFPKAKSGDRRYLLVGVLLALGIVLSWFLGR